MDGSQSRRSATSGTSFCPAASKRREKRKQASWRSQRRRRLGAAIETLEQRNLLTFAIDLFADVNMLGISSNVDEFVELGGDTIFVADDGVNGSELWKTDGTTEGTALVKDVLAGPEGSAPLDLTVVNGEVFFTALDDNGEVDLWKSDGTEAGTVQVYDADVEGTYYLTDLTESGGKLFFTAYEQATGYELWVSDGTSSGTMLVKDINSDQSVIDRPQELTDVNGTLFFTSYENGYYNRELWKSDGTAVGTVMVADLGIDPGDDLGDPADDDASFSSNPTYLTNLNGVLYFAAEDFEDGVELFKSDGTAGGTVMVPELNSSGSTDPRGLTPFAGELFFSATDGTTSTDGSSQRHLYKTDGNASTLVADTTGGLGSSAPLNFEVVGGELYFSANGVKPATTVSASSPQMTADNSLTLNGNYAGIVAETTSARGGLISGFDSGNTFNATGGGAGNIGAAGVGLTSIEVGDLYVEDIDPGDLVVNAWDWKISDPAGLTNISFNGFASANSLTTSTAGNEEGLLFELFLNESSTPVSTLELSGSLLDDWQIGRDANNLNFFDAGGVGITSATVRVSVGNSTFPNYPNGGDEAFLVGATLSADLNAGTNQFLPTGRELHKTDGTAVGTQLVKDIVPVGSSNPSQLTEVGGKLFFAADDVVGDGVELWVSDGTESGTLQLVDSWQGQDAYGAPLDGDPILFGGFGGSLLFSTTDNQQDRELWISDGTPSGTERLVDINPATDDADVHDLISVGGDLYFVADNGVDGEAIWKANTGGGAPQMLTPVSPAPTDRISQLTPFYANGNQVVFYNNSFGEAAGVFSTTLDGNYTRLFPNRPLELDNDGTMFVEFNSELYFVADDGSSGYEVWKTDGLSSATLVSDVIPGSGSSDPDELTVFAGDLYFAAETSGASVTGDIGRELFKTDGSTVTSLGDLRPGENSSSPRELTASGNYLFFAANDGSNGTELWKIDNLGVGPTMLDIRSGSNSANPFGLTDIGGSLFFAATNGSNGYEPHFSQGTDATTYQIANLNPGGDNSLAVGIDPGFFAALGEVYFAANDGTTGTELWRTTGAPGNATLVADIQVGGGSDPIPMFDTGKRLLMSASGTGFDDRELWSTDGSEANTLLVEDLYPSELFGSDPTALIEVGGKQYFVAEDGVHGRELFQLEEVAPSVSEVLVGGEAGAPAEDQQRSSVDLVTVVFEGQVDVPAGAVEVINRDTNTPLTAVAVNTRFESGKTFVEVTFDSGSSVHDRDPSGTTGLRNSLADGNYQLNILSSMVSSPVSGADMASDYQFGTVEADRFFRHFGDTDGDRDVDGQDYGRFGLAFLSSNASPAYNEDLDFDGDGDIDGPDYGQFGLRFLGRVDFQ